MSAPPFENAPYKKDVVHNLGYKPLVRAFVFMDSYSVTGWRQLPISYYESVFDEDLGEIILGRNITYEHIDDNTVRFYGPQDCEVVVHLYLEPREDAWYE